MNLKFIIAFVFLLPLVSKAQDCKTTAYLDSRTIKAGEQFTITAGEIINPPGKQFVIEQDGRVALQSARRIELNYGFKALSGSGLTASVVACDPDGTPPEPSVVYPNPTDGIITIKASYKMSAVQLTDMRGQLQLQKTGINDTALTLDLSNLKSGYYILEIIVDKSVAESIRIEKK